MARWVRSVIMICAILTLPTVFQHLCAQEGTAPTASATALAALQRLERLVEDAIIKFETTIEYKYPTNFPGNMMLDTQSWVSTNGKWRIERQIRFPNASSSQQKAEAEFDSVEILGSGVNKSLTTYFNGQLPRGTIGGKTPVTAMPTKSMLLGFMHKPFYLLLGDQATTVTEVEQDGDHYIVIEGRFEPNAELSFEVWLSQNHSLYPARIIRKLGSHVTADTRVTEWWNTSEGSFPKGIHDVLFHATEDKAIMDCHKTFSEPQWHPHVDDSTFDLSFPKGTLLHHLDLGFGRQVGAGAPEDESLDGKISLQPDDLQTAHASEDQKDAAAARRQANRQAGEATDSRDIHPPGIRPVLAVVLAVGVLVGLALVVYRKRHRRVNE